jgi:hypothetical protein
LASKDPIDATIENVAIARAPPAPAPLGPAVGDVERVPGAAQGAIVGEIVGRHGGEGAAIGALAGGARARSNEEQQRQSAQAEGAAARNSQLGTYNRATGACMEGRGCTVK